MTRAIRSLAVAVPILALVLVLAGCPKRPMTTAATAPPPVPPTAAVPATPAPVTPAPAPMAPAAAAPATAAPAQAPAPPKEYTVNDGLGRIFFAFDKSEIRPGDAKILDANAAWLTANPDQLVLIEGHCDERGTSEYNLALGERRARAAMSYLAAKGVQPSRMTVISYGEERPVCTDRTEECWSRNRRDVFLTKAR